MISKVAMACLQEEVEAQLKAQSASAHQAAEAAALLEAVNAEKAALQVTVVCTYSVQNSIQKILLQLRIS